MPSISLQPTTPTFDFKNHCFLCSEEITEEFLNKQKKSRLAVRNIIYEVWKLSVKDTVLKAVETRNNKCGQMIIDRIQHVSDFVAVDAKYHNVHRVKNLYNISSLTGFKRG